MLLSVALLTLSSAVCAGANIDPLTQPSARIDTTERTELLDAVKADSRLIAVGTRGVILMSTDSGLRWTQAATPVSVTLTSLAFPDAQNGWVVGHGGIVLHSADGGATWQRQLDGIAAAKIEQAAASLAASDAGDERARKLRLRLAQRLVADGPDKPFLAVHFSDDLHGTVVGAYGIVFHTEDGGKQWVSWMDRLPNPDGYHLYAVQAQGKVIYIAGERGFLARSNDGGRTFDRIPTPYSGSYFALSILPSGKVFLAGLNGSGYLLDPSDQGFEKSSGLGSASVLQTRIDSNGNLLVVSQAGVVLRSVDEGKSFQPVAVKTPGILPEAIVDVGGGHLVVVGFGGAAPAREAGSAAHAIAGGNEQRMKSGGNE
jgi:photosystem II stability/assembly factor-like uncharacterized protein